ncbi:S8 family peptidase [Paenibacillus sp. 2TAF8]|uniref:S8 family peptidase n=1 Tax=Paenibacillus sp. 2TAF8 TaxID=3233020 RepID=UPI003F99E270
MKSELIIKLKESSNIVPTDPENFSSAPVLTPFTKLIIEENISIHPLVPKMDVEFLESSEAPRDTNQTVLSGYYLVDAPEDRLEVLVSKLNDQEVIEAAYLKPLAQLASVPAPPETTASSPDLSLRQGYLDVSPNGIDARFAWTIPGGTGSGVNIIDIEGAWRFNHEDLNQNQGGVISGQESSDLGWRNHGTAVIGEFSGDINSYGVTGICSEANVRAISIFGNNSSSGAIVQAANFLQPGDIILIELHRPGPRYQYENRPDQAGFIPIEWWPDDFDAIQYASSRGIIVVEAGGNGSENLDDSLYDQRPTNFPSNWTNPFNRSNRDSGTIIVGAGAPPPGTHGRDHGPARSRLSFSNYGTVMDAQGWGREVTTTGYGDIQGGTDENKWYTDSFSGTSSASPIVVGALGCVQGVLRAHNLNVLTPIMARSWLRETGTIQQEGPNSSVSQRIGNLPDLKQLIAKALAH